MSYEQIKNMKRKSSALTESGFKVVKKARKMAAKKTTTLQKLNAKSPFPRLKKCDLLYESSMVPVAPGVAETALSVAVNDMFDFDRTTGAKFGNKQPLFYDNVLDAAGPYKEYYVGSWETTYWVINAASAPLSVFALPPLGATSECDSRTEAENFPGVVKEYLTKSGGAKDYCKITVKGNVSDFTGSDPRSTIFIGTYASSPSTSIYGGLVLAAGDGTTNVDAWVAVKHVFHAELQWIDALVS